jgi:hypothetical protein
MSKTSAIRVRTRYENVADFVAGYSPYFDTRGLFIRTRRIQEVGTQVRFELQLADGRPVFRGEGVVDEVREPPHSAAGMHVRIARLDRSSKALHERMTGDLLHVAEDPFEAPTFDPDNPHGLDPAAARLLGRGAESAPAARAEPIPPAPTEESLGESLEDSPLDANVLGEIAEGIEFSLDAVWSGSGGVASGPADLGGYFGSPRALVEAGLTPAGGHPAVGGLDDHPELGVGQTVPRSLPWDAETLEAFAEAPDTDEHAVETRGEGAETRPYELPPEDAFNLPSPGATVQDENRDALALLDALAESQTSEAEEEATPLPEIFSSGAFDTAEGEQVSGAPYELPLADEPPAGEDDLGLGDHALALASNYVESPPYDEATVAYPEPGSGGVTSAEDEATLEPDLEPALASPPVREPPRAPTRAGEPDLATLASATLEHEVRHRRYSFTAGESSGLNHLLSDLIESTEEHEAPPSLDLPGLAEAEGEEESAGPDAIDEFLARASTEDLQAVEKKSLLGRFFGRKKK